jgi:hypothetical protein
METMEDRSYLPETYSTLPELLIGYMQFLGCKSVGQLASVRGISDLSSIYSWHKGKYGGGPRRGEPYVPSEKLIAKVFVSEHGAWYRRAIEIRNSVKLKRARKHSDNRDTQVVAVDEKNVDSSRVVIKKTLCLSEKDACLFEEYLKTVSQATGVTMSGVLMNIMESTLPKNRDVKRICSDLYKGLDVISAFKQVFDYVSLLERKEQDRAVSLLRKSLVSILIMHNESVGWSKDGISEDLIERFKSISKCLSLRSKEFPENNELRMAAERASDGLNDAVDFPDHYQPSLFISDMLCGWNYMKHTFGIFLAIDDFFSCIECKEPLVDARDRLELIKLISELSEGRSM